MDGQALTHMDIGTVVTRRQLVTVTDIVIFRGGNFKHFETSVES